MDSLTIDVGLRTTSEHTTSYAINDRAVAADTGDIKGSACAQVVTKARLLGKSAVVLFCRYLYTQRTQVSGLGALSQYSGAESSDSGEEGKTHLERLQMGRDCVVGRASEEEE
jgi:hypothetical protein